MMEASEVLAGSTGRHCWRSCWHCGRALLAFFSMTEFEVIT